MTDELVIAATLASLVVVWIHILRRMFPANRDHRDLGRHD